MEEPFNELDKLTSKWVQEAGGQKPSSSFLNTIMETIEKQSKPVVFTPLISKKIWTILGILVIGCLLFIYWVPVSEKGLADIALVQEKLTVQNPLAGFKFSKVTAYSLGFLALFLIQIPFLKRIVNQRF